jgi:hypothetical protein
MFNLVGGAAAIMPDPADNQGSHTAPHYESGIRASFEILSIGGTGGDAKVSVEGDDVFHTDWDSGFLHPGEREAGFVSLGRFERG